MFYIYSAWRLRKVTIAYHLGQELKILVLAPIVYIGRVAYIVAQPEAPEYLKALLLFVVAQIVFVGALDYPVWKSYRSKYTDVDNDSDVISTDGDINLDVLESRRNSHK